MFGKKSRSRAVSVCMVLLIAMLLTACGTEPDSGRIAVTDLKAAKYVTLGDYKNLSVTVAPPEEVTDDLVMQQALAYFQEEVKLTGKGGVTDREVAEGDVVIMDYVGKKDGVAFEGGTASNADLEIGSGRFIDGFEEGLIGVKPGETVNLNLTFPTGYHNADLAGAKVVFTVTVHYILPQEMTDAGIAALESADYASVAEWKAYIRQQLEAAAQSNYQQNVEAALIIELIDASEFQELPEKLVAQYAADIEENVRMYASMYNMDADVFCNYVYGADLATYVAEGSAVTAQQMLVLQAIAEKEKLSISDSNLESRMETMAQENGWDSAQQMLEEYDRKEIQESLLIQDVMAFLSETATVTQE